MTFDQAKRFVEQWSTRLCPEWEIKVERGHGPDYAPNDVYASVDPKGNGMYLRATLYVGETVDDDKTDLDDRNKKRVLIHELLHLSLNDLERTAKETAKTLGPQAGLAKRMVDWQLERAVDRLAVALVEFT